METSTATDHDLTTPGHDPTVARVVLYGVDTLNFSFGQEVSEATYARLLAEKDLAQETVRERNAVYCSEWLDAQVYPHGANGFGVLIDRAGDWAIKVQRGNRNRPAVFVEVRSLILHTHPRGPLGACEDVIAYLRETIYLDLSDAQLQHVQIGKEKLSRIDYHLDYQGGWHPELGEDDQLTQFIKPARAKWSPYFEGNTCTGYSFGKRRIMARLYNKSIEARNRHNEAYFALLAASAGDAYNPDEDVWRVEFELKREGMQGFCLATPQEADDDDDVILAELEAEDLPTIGKIQKALRWSPEMWDYLTAKWLRVVVPDGDTNKGRWPTAATWMVIQGGYTQSHSAPLDDARCALVRAGRHSGYRRIITRISLDMVTTAAIMLDGDPSRAAEAFCRRVERAAGLALAHQQGQARRGRKRLDDARQEQYLANLQHLSRMAGGTFAIAGVLQQELPPVTTMRELFAHIAPDLDELAKYKGGVPQMLMDKWCRVYKVAPSRRLLKVPQVA